MPGWSNSDNKFGLTPYIVGQTLGDGCNYSSIQAAIDDAFAAGGGVVGIRPSTVPYVENLTLRQGVELYGFDVDGRLPSAISRVVIQGNHTFTVAGGFGAQLYPGRQEQRSNHLPELGSSANRYDLRYRQSSYPNWQIHVPSLDRNQNLYVRNRLALNRKYHSQTDW